MKIIIIEDNDADANILSEYLERYSKEKKREISITRYKDAIDFFDYYRSDADLILLDIEMPFMNGMEAAYKLRQIDDAVSLIFVTNVKKYALKGYEVEALDYMVKPITYYGLVDRLNRTFIKLQRNNNDFTIVKISATEAVRIAYRDVYYIEKESNLLVFHTVNGKYSVRGALKDILAEFEPRFFSLCISGCLVNLRHIEKITNTSVVINGNELPLSRLRKEMFTNDLMNYVMRRG